MQATNKVVLISGAARRIGAEIALFLHGKGLRVLLHCRHSVEQAEQICRKLNNKRTDSAHVIQADLLRLSELKKLAQDAVAHWGRVDVLVNNASAFYPTPIMNITEQEWEESLGVHIKAPFFLAQCLASELKKQKGCIVNITDIHTERPLKRYATYSVGKAGLVALTKSLALELAPEVRCNAVAPGAILWPEQESHENMHQEIIARTALKREGEPHDVARAVFFLINDADYTTGQTIVVDGGRTLRH